MENISLIEFDHIDPKVACIELLTFLLPPKARVHVDLDVRLAGAGATFSVEVDVGSDNHARLITWLIASGIPYYDEKGVHDSHVVD